MHEYLPPARPQTSIFVRALILGLGAAAVACLPSPVSAQQGGPALVEVAPAVLEETAPTTRLVGTVRPRLRTVVASEVQGLVAELPVDGGDQVTKGQVICRLRDAPRRLAQAEAIARQAELEALTAVRAAELTKAQFEVDRLARLGDAQRTEKELQNSRADCDAAKANLEQARYAAEAQKATVERLADDLARTEIRAPFDGFIVSKRTEVGAWVNQGGAVVELVDLSTVRIRVSAPESMVQFCSLGAETQVDVEALRKTFPGRVSRVVPDADERARTFPVEIDIENPAGELKAGMFVRAAVPSGRKAENLLVPKDAVVVRGPLSLVYVVRKNEAGAMAVPLPVVVGSEVLDRVAVQAQGLVPGDMVVVRGNEFMLGPTPVIPMPKGAPTAEPPPGQGRGLPGAQPTTQPGEQPPHGAGASPPPGAAAPRPADAAQKPGAPTSPNAPAARPPTTSSPSANPPAKQDDPPHSTR
jgi:RND family efflux transporter MFP subunit